MEKEQNQKTDQDSTDNIQDNKSEIETKKENRKYKFQVLEHYNGDTQIVNRFDFKDQAKEFAEFHNKNQVWLVNGGIPKHLCIS